MSQEATATIINAVPVGTVVSNIFNQTPLPTGWLPCDGSTFDNTQYPQLYQMLGNKNVLPDLRGYFLRGLDPSGKIDPDGANRAALSVQQDQFASHTHGVSPIYPWSRSFEGSDQRPGIPYCQDGPGSITTSSAGGNETRPKNVAVYYIIFAGLQQTDAGGHEQGHKGSDRGEAK